jgi:hypothetical protein
MLDQAFKAVENLIAGAVRSYRGGEGTSSIREIGVRDGRGLLLLRATARTNGGANRSD